MTTAPWGYLTHCRPWSGLRALASSPHKWVGARKENGQDDKKRKKKPLLSEVSLYFAIGTPMPSSPPPLPQKKIDNSSDVSVARVEAGQQQASKIISAGG